ncbi:MAG: transcriptional repressor [Saprospiraceae bacterium]
MKSVEDILKKHKLRATSVRKEILSLFLKTKNALSNNDIEYLLSNIDRITLYRSLKTFQEKGIIHKAFDGTDTSRYAVCSTDCTEHQHYDEHLHFHCSQCDNTFCVEEAPVPYITIPKGFKAHKTNIVIEGHCENCS